MVERRNPHQNIEKIKKEAQKSGRKETEIQKRHIDSQLQLFERIALTELQISPEARKKYKELFEQGLSSSEIKNQVKDLPTEEQKNIAKALAARHLAEGNVERYALAIDGLTGLNKEAVLNEFLEEKLKDANEVTGIHFDIDHFKKFNDNYGHAAGDYVLKVAAEIFKDQPGFAARRHDRGEEFVLVLTEKDLPENETDLQAFTAKIAEEIRTRLENHPFHFYAETSESISPETNFNTSIVQETVTASLGVAKADQNDTPAEFLERIEHTSVYAKSERGRNNVAVFNEHPVADWHQQKIQSTLERIGSTSPEMETVPITQTSEIKRLGPEYFRQRKEDVFNKAQKIETESQTEIFVEEVWSEESFQILETLSERVEQGTFPHLEEFTEMIETIKNALSEEELKNLWFAYAAIAETDTEYFGDLAARDKLTGLYNRTELDRKIKQEFENAEKNNEFVSVAIVDMDHFKRNINDTFGHGAGDLILQQIAFELHQSLRVSDRLSSQSLAAVPEYRESGEFQSSDTLARGRRTYNPDLSIPGRYGGEEFILIMPGVDADQAKEILQQRIVERIRKTDYHINEEDLDQLVNITLSVGISDNQMAQDPSEALHQADMALYYSKLNGRDQANIYSPEIETIVKDEIQKAEEKLR